MMMVVEKPFYVGKRGNSKFTRVYEKGKQFGDVNSPWVRFETEFRAGDIDIPLEFCLSRFRILAVPIRYVRR